MSSDSPFSSLASLAPASLGPLPTFVELDEKYLCTVCKRVLQAPVQTPCGHRMCKACLDQLFDGHPAEMAIRCPGKEETCEDITRDGVYPDFCAQRELRQQKVFCSFRDNGCPATVMWGKLSAHEADCGYRGRDCPYKELGCTKKIAEKHWDKHIYTDCDFVPVPCKFCTVNIPKSLMEEHIRNQCPEAELPCPYDCGVTRLRREQIEAHKESCPARPRKCSKHIIGCTFQGTEKQIQEHTANSVVIHDELLSKKLSEVAAQTSEMKEALVDMNTKNAELKNKVKEVERENNRLKTSAETFEKRAQALTKTVASQSEKINKLEDQVKDSAKQDQVSRHELEIIRLKDGVTNAESSINSLGRRSTNSGGSGARGGMSEDVRLKLMTHDRSLGIHDVRLAEVELRFQCLETVSYDGSLIWKITEYARRKQEAVSGKTLSLYSQPFYSSRFGYKMCARVYLNGDGMGKGTHMSLFFVVMRGEYDNLVPWPFRQKTTLTLLDQDPAGRHVSDTFRPDPTSSSFRKPVSEMNVASGCPLFVPHATVEGKTYLKDDNIFIKASIDKTDLVMP